MKKIMSLVQKLNIKWKYWKQWVLNVKSKEKNLFSSDTSTQTWSDTLETWTSTVDTAHCQKQIQFLTSYILSLQQFFLLQSFILTILTQFISYLQSTSSIMFVSQSQSGLNSSSGSDINDKTSTLKSFIMSASVIYMSLSASESADTSHFNDTNVTDFLEIWEMLCQDHDLLKRSMMQCLFSYCTDLINEHIKFLSEYEFCEWKRLKKWLHKNHLWQNLKQ